MKTFMLSMMMTAGSLLAVAQGHKADEKIIEKQVDAFFTSWNKHNFDDMYQYTTEDCSWINVVGMWWKGRKQVQYAHQTLHNGMFKNTPLTKVSTQMKFVTKDVAIVYVISHAGAYYPPDGIDRGGNKLGDENDIATMVFVKQAGNWLLTSAQNVPINEHAAKSNPVLKMQ